MQSPIGVGERVIAPLPLKSRIAWFLAILDAPEERCKGFVQPAQDILQHLAVISW